MSAKLEHSWSQPSSHRIHLRSKSPRSVATLTCHHLFLTLLLVHDITSVSSDDLSPACSCPVPGSKPQPRPWSIQAWD